MTPTPAESHRNTGGEGCTSALRASVPGCDAGLTAAGRLRVLDLFSGIGGIALGLERAGLETAAFCEIDPNARRVLAKHWPDTTIYDDIRTVTADRLAADGIRPNFIAGGFPCQDLSVANTTAQGLSGSRSGLFYEVVRLIGELRPEGVLLENVAALLSRGLGDVLGALASLGYDAEWHCIPASHLGAAHRRDRIWILAHPQCAGWQGPQSLDGLLGSEIEAFAKSGNALADGRRILDSNLAGLRGRDGVSVGVERARLKQCGNSVVPQIPEIIGRAILSARALEQRAAA